MDVRLLVTTAFATLVLSAPAVAAGPPQPQEMPPATYKTVSKEEMVAMDDGVNVASTVTFPSLDGNTAAPGHFPVVVQMTPYGRDGVCGSFPGNDLAER